MRSLLFYPKLAVSGMRRNKILYVPYLFAASLMVMLFYILSSMTWIVGSSGIAGGNQMSILLMLSSVVCGLLTVLILFYLNGYVIKQRSREFGLYSVLGLGKGNLCLLLFWEILFSCIGSLVCGIAAGAVFSQLMYLLLLNITHLPVNMEIWVPLGAVNVTVFLFAAGWGIVLLRNIVRIFRSDPIEILRRTAQGEQEPRSRRLMAFAGAGTLIAGYALASAVQSPSMVLLLFLPAAILVIIATYCIFSALSIVILKALRKNRRFYYQPGNFINVSGMLYRMKQNAVGLANICILASAVLVTISSCVCLYAGEEDMLNSLYPREVSVTAYYHPLDGEEKPDLLGLAQQTASRYDMQLLDPMTLTRRIGYMHRSGNELLSTRISDQVNLTVEYRLASDLSTGTGQIYSLSDHEVLVSSAGEFPDGTVLTIDGTDFTVRSADQDPVVAGYLEASGATSAPVFFFGNEEEMNEAFRYEESPTLACRLFFDYDLDAPNAEAFRNALTDDLLNQLGSLSSSIKSDARTEFYTVYGSLLFVGLFFVALFLIATVLIIYYKQITEGYEDRQRFSIMQQVGLSDREVRSTIRRQVLMVFFLPILMALVHIAFAFPALQKIMTLFEMHNTTLFIICVVGSALVFLGFYTAVYLITARTYYHIVKSAPQ